MAVIQTAGGYPAKKNIAAKKPQKRTLGRERWESKGARKNCPSALSAKMEAGSQTPGIRADEKGGGIGKKIQCNCWTPQDRLKKTTMSRFLFSKGGPKKVQRSFWGGKKVGGGGIKWPKIPNDGTYRRAGSRTPRHEKQLLGSLGSKIRPRPKLHENLKKSTSEGMRQQLECFSRCPVAPRQGAPARGGKTRQGERGGEKYSFTEKGTFAGEKWRSFMGVGLVLDNLQPDLHGKIEEEEEQPTNVAEIQTSRKANRSGRSSGLNPPPPTAQGAVDPAARAGKQIERGGDRKMKMIMGPYA